MTLAIRKEIIIWSSPDQFLNPSNFCIIETQEATVPIAKICGPGMSMPIPATTVATLKEREVPGEPRDQVDASSNLTNVPPKSTTYGSNFGDDLPTTMDFLSYRKGNLQLSAFPEF